ncbi:hypothetical protein FGB62_50g012 [Gracilaria domingensis]|nr:hypothetical protein FGB62_50g012 [Gracilaria domingensis]
MRKINRALCARVPKTYLTIKELIEAREKLDLDSDIRNAKKGKIKISKSVAEVEEKFSAAIVVNEGVHANCSEFSWRSNNAVDDINGGYDDFVNFFQGQSEDKCAALEVLHKLSDGSPNLAGTAVCILVRITSRN